MNSLLFKGQDTHVTITCCSGQSVDISICYRSMGGHNKHDCKSVWEKITSHSRFNLPLNCCNHNESMKVVQPTECTSIYNIAVNVI